MPTRREFVVGTAVATGGVKRAFASVGDATQSSRGSRPTKPLRILFLGGTGFIGSHHVHAALRRGHRVAVFSRGTRSTELPPEVERLTGDRNGNLESIERRDWDSVVDLATYVPGWVRSLGEALNGRVRHYTFISSVGVYDNPAAILRDSDERSKLERYTGAEDPYRITELNEDATYGSMKVLCEQEAKRQFSQSLIVRPGVIVGPTDSVGAFTYWAVRVEKGGEVLAAGDPLARVQLIDVRDLAEWVIRMIEARETGPYNASGPAMPMGWAELLGALRGPTSGYLKLTWVPTSWLSERAIQPWSNLLYWPCEIGRPGLMHTINDKAIAQGLTFRPLSETIADTRTWYNSLPTERQAQVLQGIQGTNTAAIQDSMAREREILEDWHAHSR